MEIPLLFIANRIDKKLCFLYGIAILLAMLTSAMSAGFGFMQNISNNEKKQKVCLIVLCIVSVLMSDYGFSNLVRTLYPVFGYVGLLQLFNIVIT